MSLHHRVGRARPRRVRSRRARLHARCDAAARPRRATAISAATPDPDTDAWLSEHRFGPRLDQAFERRDESPRGTAGRGQLSVEARRTASTLDDSPGPKPGQPTAYPVARPGARQERGARGNTSRNERPQSAVIEVQPSMVAIGGSTTMQLRTFPRLRREPDAPPSTASMRVMETGLALVAIAVALLLNLGR